jgi:peroxiredoxin
MIMPSVSRVPLDGNIIPAFELPRAGGGSIRIRAYRGRRSPALYFLHAADCPPCRDLAVAILPRYGDYALADAEPLVILPGRPDAAESFRRDLALPFPVLVDRDGAVGRRYGVTDGDIAGAALLVADRFGAPALWQPAGTGHDLPDQDAVLRELEYLSHTCSAGCATPIWDA